MKKNTEQNVIFIQSDDGEDHLEIHDNQDGTVRIRVRSQFSCSNGTIEKTVSLEFLTGTICRAIMKADNK